MRKFQCFEFRIAVHYNHPTPPWKGAEVFFDRINTVKWIYATNKNQLPDSDASPSCASCLLGESFSPSPTTRFRRLGFASLQAPVF
jgi:hypothetical protein